MQVSILTKRKLLLVSTIFLSLVTYGQTEMDAIMMNKNQFCSGFEYMHASWDTYWEGSLKRTNENIGTVTTQSVMFMPNYGITDRLNIMGSASYVWTKASAGTLSGMKGFQDISVYMKWIPYQTRLADGTFTSFAIAGFTTPSSNYVIDFLPLSIGLGSSNITGRAMIDYNYHRITFTASAAYIRRSNIKLDRTSYYTTELHQSNEVKMPDAAQYQFRTGYRGKYLIAEAVITNWTTLGGFDITRNNMPFPSNRMNATTLGAHFEYTFKGLTNLSILAGVNTTLKGRNMGQSDVFSGGAFYVINTSKKATPKK